MQKRSPAHAFALIALALAAAAPAGARPVGPPAPGPAVTAGHADPRRLAGALSEENADLVLYQLRDRVFHDTPGGRRATELLYGHIGAMVTAVASDPQTFRDLGRGFLLSWYGPLGELVEGRGASATLGQAQVGSLLAYWNAMKAAGSPALRQALQREEARLDIPGWAGLTMEEWLARVDRLSCAPSDTALCLNGGRFRVEASWRTPQGRTGRARAVPLTSDTGYLWFFDDANVEAVVKVLDACSISDHFWVFAAGLTNVEVRLSVADTATGRVRTYDNPIGTPFQPLQDGAAFATCGASGAGAAEWRQARAAEAAAQGATAAAAPAAPAPAVASPAALARHLVAALGPRRVPRPAHACAPGPEALCLQGGRFRVETEWETPRGSRGKGRAVPLTADTGYFWFFRDSNVEQVVKVHDACAFDQSFWVFAAGLTNVRVLTTVTDTHTGASRTYRNDQGRAFQPVQDTDAFPACP